MLQLSSPKFCRLFSLIGVVLAFFAIFSLWHNDPSLDSIRATLDQHLCSNPPIHNTPLIPSSASSSLPQVRKNVVLATRFGYHHDVVMALAWTLERVMKGQGRLSVYAPSPLSWNFQDVVRELGLYHGTMRNYEDLIRDITHDVDIDLIILGTCEIDVRDWRDQLLEAWDARDADHKFKLVCMVHNAADTYWQLSVPEWSRRSAFRILTISQHVADAFKSSFLKLSSSPDPRIYSAGYEYIPIDVHSHILDIHNLPDPSPTRILSNAVIQGFFDSSRRDYEGIFKELMQYLREDPKIWGYHPLGTGPSYTPDTSLPYPPFHLHLAGTGNLHIPPELAEVVVTHTTLDYNQYYSLMGSMDVCVPAFTGTDDRYYLTQASSTVGMCMEVNTPLLVTQRTRDAYSYIDDDRVVITRPAAVREMEVIKAFRTGNASALLASDPGGTGTTMGEHPHIRQAVEKMMQEGWVRRREGFEAAKKEIWSQNDEFAWRLVRDL